MKIDESSKSCSIFLVDFGIDKVASPLPCKNYFHNDCIVPWLNRSNTCPLCRHKLPQEDEDEIEKDLQSFFDGVVDNSVVVVSTPSLGLSEVGEDRCS